MTYTDRTDIADGTASPPPIAAPIGKVVALFGDDREAVPHCRVLLDVLRNGLARDVILAIGKSAGANGLDTIDVGLVDLNCGAPWHNPLQTSAEAWKLARMLEAERPDVLHMVGLGPATLAGVALRLVQAPAALVHLPDLGPLASQPAGMAWPYRKVALRLLASLVRKPRSFLLVGCDDDLSELRALGIDPGPRFAVVSGAGVDPEVYPVLPPSPNEMPLAAFVGPANEGNGLPVLMQAFERLWARGLRLQLEIHGGPESADVPEAEREKWTAHPGVRWTSGWPADAREVWRRAEICVWPAQTRQGLPRALLEAAACGRALVIPDAAGGALRALVRDDVEGLVVPAGDVGALGAALERLARDAGLRQRMGAAARLRVLQGFTEAHVKETLRSVYLSLLSQRG